MLASLKVNELLVQKAKGDKTSVETAQSDIMGKGKKSNGRNVKENEDSLGLDLDLKVRRCSSLRENGKAKSSNQFVSPNFEKVFVATMNVRK